MIALGQISGKVSFEKGIVRDRDDMKKTLTQREREGYGETEAPAESNRRRKKLNEK